MKRTLLPPLWLQESSLCCLMQLAAAEGNHPLLDLDWSENYSFPRELILVGHRPIDEEALEGQGSGLPQQKQWPLLGNCQWPLTGLGRWASASTQELQLGLEWLTCNPCPVPHANSLNH